MNAHRRRWSDSDHYFGPLTFSFGSSYRHYAIILMSGDDEGHAAAFRISIGPTTFMLALPRWLVPPEKRKVVASTWDEGTIERLGRNWYWYETERRYGVTIHAGHLSLHYGRQTMDSSTEQTVGWFLPWTQWRFVRHSLYGLDGALFATLPAHARFGTPEYAVRDRLTALCPTAKFNFIDFDGERLMATTKIEEREWRFGTGWFKWLSLFRQPKIRRSLDIQFSGETGRHKGSWKGGTVGHSVDMLAGERHAAAFERYCGAHDMRLIPSEEACPGHIASKDDPKVCARCGVHIDSLRPQEE